MSYFPARLMPLTIKVNASGSFGVSGARISAQDYNLHDQEILAIETYLGLNGTVSSPGVSGSQPAQPSGASGTSPALIANIISMTDQLNTFSQFGMQGTSGYVLNGLRLVFPQAAHFAYLAAAPGATDTAISVDSTIGFPDSGVISILNDVDQSVSGSSTAEPFPYETMVEWISYTGRTATQFQNCQRGWLGTSAGSHSGTVLLPTAGTSNKNVNDLCAADVGFTICTNRVPSQGSGFGTVPNPIPVFQGRMGVQYGISCLIRSDTVLTDAMQVFQTADGRAYAFVTDRKNKDHTLQGTVAYQTFFAMSACDGATYSGWNAARGVA